MTMQCKNYRQALEIANFIYECDHLVDPKDKVYFRRTWHVILDF